MADLSTDPSTITAEMWTTLVKIGYFGGLLLFVLWITGVLEEDAVWLA